MNVHKIALQIASVGGLGRAPVASGTFGTLGALPFLILVPNVWPLFICSLLVLFVGVWASTLTAQKLDCKDPSLVVVDEVAGMLVACLALPLNPLNVLILFLLFRLFDIVKPTPVRQLEALPGGWGIMLDDVMAGVYANLAFRVLLLVEAIL